MVGRRLDARGREVDPGHRGAQARERLAQQAAAAADVERGKPRKRLRRQGIAPEVRADAIAHVAEAGRIELVQRRQRAGLVPPVRREVRKTLELSGIGAACHGRSASPAGHANLLAPARPTMYTPP